MCTITTPNDTQEAVEPTVHIDVWIEGVPVHAMVETGAQSTIISQTMLYEIGEHLRPRGCLIPVLEKLTVCVWGERE